MLPGNKSRKTTLFVRLCDVCRIIERASASTEAIRRVQRLVRRRREQRVRVLRGPAIHERGLCVNPSELVTTVPMTDIPDSDFISFVDGKRVYGFDTHTLSTSIAKWGPRNPYTRQDLPPSVVAACRALLCKHSRFGTPEFVFPSGAERPVRQSRSLSSPDYAPFQTHALVHRAVEIFGVIEQTHGYVVSSSWLLSLTPSEAVDVSETLRRRLMALTPRARRRILPQSSIRSLFPRSARWYRSRPYIDDALVKGRVLDVFERLITEATDVATRGVGALHALRALACVSAACRSAMPYLI